MYYIYLQLHHLLITIIIFIKRCLYLCKISCDINLSLYRSSNERYCDMQLMSLYRMCRDIVLSRYSSVTHENDHIKYLRILNDGYTKNINFLESHTRIFNDKMFEINENFYVNNVQNCDSVYIYGILDTNKEGLKYDLPSVKFEKPYLNIDNIKFENPIDNYISAYDELKSKSNHYDNFLITYPNFKNYYRIYLFNVSRNI